jgi:hypothetical protein
MDSKPLNLLLPTYTQPTPCTQPPLPHTHHHHRHNQTNFTTTNNNNNSTSCLPTDLPQPTQPSPTHHAFPTSHLLSQPRTTPQSSTHHQPPSNIIIIITPIIPPHLLTIRQFPISSCIPTPSHKFTPQPRNLQNLHQLPKFTILLTYNIRRRNNNNSSRQEQTEG